MRIYDRYSVKDYAGDGSFQSKRLVAMVSSSCSEQWIKNTHCEVLLIGNDSGAVPLVIPKEVKGNCYVCSFRGHYLDYARDELEALSRPLLNLLARPIFWLMRGLLKWIDSEQVVFIDNWLLSTNLHKEWLTENVQQVIDVVKQKYPDKTLVIRSLNTFHNAELISKTKQLGFLSLLSRKIYIFEASENRGSQSQELRSDLKKDLKLLAQSKFYFEDWSDTQDSEGAERIIELYQQLYLGKYSQLNPQFTKLWLTNGVETGYLRVRVIKQDAQIIAVLGFVQVGDIVTAPLVGYQIDKKSKPSLYRLITAELSRIVLDENLRANRSGGADQFKLNRGAVATFESSAILAKGNGYKRWKSFVWFVNWASRNIMK